MALLESDGITSLWGLEWRRGRGSKKKRKDIEECEQMREAIDCVIKVVEKEVISRWR